MFFCFNLCDWLSMNNLYFFLVQCNWKITLLISGFVFQWISVIRFWQYLIENKRLPEFERYLTLENEESIVAPKYRDRQELPKWFPAYEHATLTYENNQKYKPWVCLFDLCYIVRSNFNALFLFILWILLDFPMGILWLFHGYSVVIPWLFCGYSVVILWLFLFYSIG